jgi:DNA-binding GntR family transcriptional regulator
MDAAARLGDDNSQERAYRYLKDAILNLEFRANAPMRAQSIAQSLKVSRTPVREALSRLEQEGLVARAGGWGYVVKPVSLKEALDIYKVREALEVEAVREAISNVEGAQLERMRACLKRAGEEIRKQRLNRFRDNTREFYHLIAEATGNACLQAMLMTIEDRIRLLGALMAHKHLGRPNESLAENLAVLKAIEAADEAGAEEAVRKHVSKARETLLRHVMDKPDRILI